MKNFAGDIIILKMCTKNHNCMMYSSWETEWDRHNFLSFWAIFCHFNWPRKSKFWKIKKKKTPEDISLQMCNINDNHMMYGSWEINHDRIFYHFGSFFGLKKKEKNSYEYYRFTPLHHKWQSYDACFLKYRVQHNIIFNPET